MPQNSINSSRNCNPTIYQKFSNSETKIPTYYPFNLAYYPVNNKIKRSTLALQESIKLDPKHPLGRSGLTQGQLCRHIIGKQLIGSSGTIYAVCSLGCGSCSCQSCQPYTAPYYTMCSNNAYISGCSGALGGNSCTSDTYFDYPGAFINAGCKVNGIESGTYSSVYSDNFMYNACDVDSGASPIPGTCATYSECQG